MARADESEWWWRTGAFAFLALMLLRDRRILQRLADVEVPTGVLPFTLFLIAGRQRQTDKALARFEQVTGEFGEFVGSRMKEADRRNEEVLELNRSVERLTRRLVVLTVVVGVLGAGAIVATLVQ